jgi:hypothetical protein
MGTEFEDALPFRSGTNRREAVDRLLDDEEVAVGEVGQEKARRRLRLGLARAEPEEHRRQAVTLGMRALVHEEGKALVAGLADTPGKLGVVDVGRAGALVGLVGGAAEEPHELVERETIELREGHSLSLGPPARRNRRFRALRASASTERSPAGDARAHNAKRND